MNSRHLFLGLALVSCFALATMASAQVSAQDSLAGTTKHRLKAKIGFCRNYTRSHDHQTTKAAREKLTLALDYLSRKGYDFDSSRIRLIIDVPIADGNFDAQPVYFSTKDSTIHAPLEFLESAKEGNIDEFNILRTSSIVHELVHHHQLYNHQMSAHTEAMIAAGVTAKGFPSVEEMYDYLSPLGVDIDEYRKERLQNELEATIIQRAFMVDSLGQDKSSNAKECIARYTKAIARYKSEISSIE